MILWAKRWESAVRRLTAAALIGALTLTGCGKKSGPEEQAGSSSAEAPVAAAKNEARSVSSKAKDDPATAPLPQDGKHVPFAQATRGGDDPPANSNPPPDVTVSGKPVYKIYKEVQALWDTIRFVTPDGKPIHYSATVETDFGPIELALRPDLAPSHVRNFVALARAGYYDGLLFDRICREQNEVEPGKVVAFESIEAGCPLGNGEPGNGSIGYWLKPEFPSADAKVTHEPGTVGACHGSEPDTAACRFYITLCDAPFLDGNFTIFGKVTSGLDVARIISRQPTREYDEDVAGSHRPDKPIKITKITIHTSVAEAGR